MHHLLLAKQIWRFIQNPNSLVARVFKARYFKHSDIMDASIGLNPSYIWRSVFWSKQTISTGLFWKINNGRKVHARKDRWIPELASGRITSHKTFDSNTMIHNLITPDNTWDVPKLNYLFLIHEADAIRKIPIAQGGDNDSRFWIHDKKGQYTVKTAYWQARSILSTTLNVNTCSPSTISDVWHKIWRLDVPPKVRIFLWKAAHDIVASEGNLASHHVPCPPRCVLCGFHWADINHAIFSCQVVKEAWKSTEWWKFIKVLRKGSSESLTIHCIKTLNTSEMEKLAMKMWGVWKERCDLTHKKGGTNPKTIQANWTDTLLYQYHNERSRLLRRQTTTSLHSRSPSLPLPLDHFTLKVDAAYNEASLSFTVAFYVCDRNGAPRAAGFHKINPPGSIMATEITAIVDGLSFFLGNFQDSVTVFSDSIDAIQAVKSDYHYEGYEEYSIVRAHTLYNHTAVKGLWYCPRSENTAAHNLAQLATKSRHPHAWVNDDIPRHILSLAQNHHTL